MELSSASRWNLERAYAAALQIQTGEAAARTLLRALLGDDVELRKRASDVARRITEKDRRLLRPYADTLIGLLAEIPAEENRTRWHLGLVAARVAHTRAQRVRVASLLYRLLDDASNVVRCSAIEGLGEIALHEISMRPEIELVLEHAWATGTPAMKCRARKARERLRRTMRA